MKKSVGKFSIFLNVLKFWTDIKMSKIQKMNSSDVPYSIADTFNCNYYRVPI